MPKFLSFSNGAVQQAPIIHPEKPVDEAVWLDGESLQCLLSTAHRTHVPVSDLLSHIVKEWYELSYDVPGPHLRWEIAELKRKSS